VRSQTLYQEPEYEDEDEDEGEDEEEKSDGEEKEDDTDSEQHNSMDMENLLNFLAQSAEHASLTELEDMGDTAGGAELLEKKNPLGTISAISFY
jgi:hypothetical protein